MRISVPDALGVCVQALEVAQRKGAYTLEQAEGLYNAVQILTKVQEELNKGGIPAVPQAVDAYHISRDAIRLAQSKGAYSLADVPKIMESFKALDGVEKSVLSNSKPAQQQLSEKGKERAESASGCPF